MINCLYQFYRLHAYIIVSLINSLQLIIYAILNSSKLVSNSSGTHRSFPQVSVPRKPECPVCQTGLSRFGVWVFEYILCESTSIGSSGYCYSLLLFIKCLKVNWVGFMVNSLTKPDCSICQTGLSDFDSSNSAVSFVKFHNRLFTPSWWHQETFNWYQSLIFLIGLTA
jgi:hypothetical protein